MTNPTGNKGQNNQDGPNQTQTPETRINGSIDGPVYSDSVPNNLGSDTQSVLTQQQGNPNVTSSTDHTSTNAGNTNPVENVSNQVSNFITDTLAGVIPNEQSQNIQNPKNKKMFMIGIFVVIVLVICCLLSVLGVIFFGSAYDGLFGPYGNRQQNTNQQNNTSNNQNKNTDNENNNQQNTEEDRKVKREFVKIFSASGESGTSSSTKSFTVKDKKNLKFVGSYKNVSRFGSCIMTVIIKGVTDQTYFSYAQTVEIAKGKEKTQESMVYNVPEGEYYLNVSGYGCEWKVDVYESK